MTEFCAVYPTTARAANSVRCRTGHPHPAANVPNPTDAILALNESARDVSTIGTFAPSTSPAHSPPPTYTKLL